MNWISFHIYLDGDRHDFIKNCASPLLNSTMFNSWVTNFFYVLYHDQGAHVRLRLKLKDIKHSEVVSSYVNNTIQKYFQSSGIQIPNMHAGRYVNNAIYTIPYEPEIERYGGDVGITISEKQFENSSKVIIRHLESKKKYDVNRALNLAIRLHLVSAWVYCNGNIDDCIHLFNYIYVGRLFRQYSPFIKFDNETSSLYSKIINPQLTTLVPYVETIWQCLNDKNIFDHKLDEWLQCEKTIKSELELALFNGRLEIPAPIENHSLWYLLQSYMHMTYNRLGISTVDEPLVSYMIMRSLHKIKNTSINE